MSVRFMLDRKGERVRTKFGLGTILGVEYIFDWSRLVVELDDPAQWGGGSQPCCFYPCDVVVPD